VLPGITQVNTNKIRGSESEKKKRITDKLIQRKRGERSKGM